ncbi:MAG: NADH-quinone oxidoreductase subunit A [Bdellovibrionaceae bacterium]|nr:NADH-quinone oxidoreductase subunit A [Pseudobdellovibrionaceae bacterium]|tara:strand:- start:6504 stop:6866 length:363 start_codon:yes stop_codon:yes gene_type:complete
MEYIPVLVMMGAGTIIGGAILLISHLLGPKVGNTMKDRPFECGVPSVGAAMNQRVSVRFYLVSILFLLFDVEALFFYPWAVVFKKYLSVNSFILLEMGLFVGILLVGYFYVLKKGALEWD